jgi:hypothetical protein
LEKPASHTIKSEITKLEQEQKTTEIQAHEKELEAHLDLDRDESFAYSVAALKVEISIGAIAALLRRRPLWYVSLGIAMIGLVFMVVGTSPRTPEVGETSPTATSVTD